MIDEVGRALLFFNYRKINKTFCPADSLHCRHCTNSANSFKIQNLQVQVAAADNRPRKNKFAAPFHVLFFKKLKIAGVFTVAKVFRDKAVCPSMLREL